MGVVNERNDIKIYLNGSLDLISSSGLSNAGSIDNNYEVVIGNWAESGVMQNQWFRGTIDEVRIYNRALSEKEVEKLYGLA